MSIKKRILAAICVATFGLTAPPGAAAQDVVVAGTREQAVPVTGKVRIVPTLVPFQKDVSIEVPPGHQSAFSSFNVPAGKRLVLEYVSGSTEVDVEEAVRVNVITDVGRESVSHTVAPIVYRRELPPDVHQDFIVTFAQLLRIYADGGSQVTFIATRSENLEITPTFFQLSVSGYLVSCTSDPDCPIP